ncbi:MAG: hypothetical protein DHS20C14_08580 [Phycisphaeraceae bacterium]|nr:MAG: hypothetical protein DHS20C14_08580 [Phycisphaeraceae bacterium]
MTTLHAPKLGVPAQATRAGAIVAAHDPTRPRSPRRWALASVGVACVGLAALGVVTPGLPTTVFLIVASWCFARSCPWLEQRLIRNRFFGPFLRYLEPGAVMPKKAMWITLAMMWTAIAVSVATILASDAPVFVAPSVVLAGAVGTWFVARLTRPRG